MATTDYMDLYGRAINEMIHELEVLRQRGSSPEVNITKIKQLFLGMKNEIYRLAEERDKILLESKIPPIA